LEGLNTNVESHASNALAFKRVNGTLDKTDETLDRVNMTLG
jgi:hypothetical protein